MCAILFLKQPFQPLRERLVLRALPLGRALHAAPGAPCARGHVPHAQQAIDVAFVIHAPV